MGRLQAEEMANQVDRYTALRWHLHYNHVPSIPLSMIDVCSDAIDAINDGDADRIIPLPDEVSWQGKDEAPAWAIAQGHHLDSFIDMEYHYG